MSTEKRFTPGHWYVVEHSGLDYGAYCYSIDGSIDPFVCLGVNITKAEDAHLMAAAPCMYDLIEGALLDLKCCYDVNGDSMEESDASDKLRLALKKARGEA